MRGASLAAMTVLTLGALSVPAVAQIVRDHRTGGTGSAASAANVANKPLRIYLTSLYCAANQNEDTWPRKDRDEPHVLVFAADLRGSTAKGSVTISPVFSDVDNGHTRELNLQCYPLEGGSTLIGTDNDYLVLVAAMESDNNLNPGTTVNKLRSVLLPKLQAYKGSGMGRTELSYWLRRDMDVAIDAARGSYGNEDDRVGQIHEIKWGQTALDTARAGRPQEVRHLFYGGGSGYSVIYRLE
jgi:hypothetical protein